MVQLKFRLTHWPIWVQRNPQANKAILDVKNLYLQNFILLIQIFARFLSTVNFINCITPYADHFHPTLNFYSQKTATKFGLGHEQFGIGCKPFYEINPLSRSKQAAIQWNLRKKLAK